MVSLFQSLFLMFLASNEPAVEFVNDTDICEAEVGPAAMMNAMFARAIFCCDTKTESPNGDIEYTECVDSPSGLCGPGEFRVIINTPSSGTATPSCAPGYQHVIRAPVIGGLPGVYVCLPIANY